jgi:hypothetical protein
LDDVQVSETLLTLVTVKDCEDSAAPVAWPLLEVPAVGDVALLEPVLAELDAELFDEFAELFAEDGELLCDPEDWVPFTLTSSLTCLLSSELSPVS